MHIRYPWPRDIIDGNLLADDSREITMSFQVSLKAEDGKMCCLLVLLTRWQCRLDDDDGLMPPPSRRTHFRNALAFYRYLMSAASTDMATTRSTSRMSWSRAGPHSRFSSFLLALFLGSVLTHPLTHFPCLTIGNLVATYIAVLLDKRLSFLCRCCKYILLLCARASSRSVGSDILCFLSLSLSPFTLSFVVRTSWADPNSNVILPHRIEYRGTTN